MTVSSVKGTDSVSPVDKSACGCAKSLQLCPTLCHPTDCSPPGSSVLGILQARILYFGLLYPPPGDLSNSGIKPRSPALQAYSSPAEPLGKPRNTGVGSLSLLQGIFLTQESNQGLLHCRWILYQLSYQGSPSIMTDGSKVEWVERSVPGMAQKCTLCLDSIAMNWIECW